MSKKVITRTLSLFFVALTSLSLSLSISPPSALAASSTYPATITKITDGDTVWVRTNGSRLKLRLLGIDTPEEYYSKKINRIISLKGKENVNSICHREVIEGE